MFRMMCWSACLALALSRTCEAQDRSDLRLRLTRDSVVAGVRCAPTGRAYAALHPNGSLDECPLAADTVIAGHALARGTWIRLTPAGVLDGAWLARDLQLQSVPCKGTGYKGWSVRFHASGGLALCYLSRETLIDGVPCRAGAFLTELSGSTQVLLHPSGRLRSCRLARDLARDGLIVRRGERIALDEAGRLLPPARRVH